MDINLVNQLLVPILVLIGTQGVKKIQAIPVNQGQTARVRAVAGVLSFVSAGLIAWVDGSLESFLSPQVIEVGVVASLSWILAHIGYKSILKR